MRKKIGHIVLSLFLEDLMIFKSRYTRIKIKCIPDEIIQK